MGFVYSRTRHRSLTSIVKLIGNSVNNATGLAVGDKSEAIHLEFSKIRVAGLPKEMTGQAH